MAGYIARKPKQYKGPLTLLAGEVTLNVKTDLDPINLIKTNAHAGYFYTKVGEILVKTSRDGTNFDIGFSIEAGQGYNFDKMDIQTLKITAVGVDSDYKAFLL